MAQSYTNLKPCPFCGDRDATVEHIDVPEYKVDETVVRCTNCGALGPWASGYGANATRQAIELWQARPIQQED